MSDDTKPIVGDGKPPYTDHDTTVDPAVDNAHADPDARALNAREATHEGRPTGPGKTPSDGVSSNKTAHKR